MDAKRSIASPADRAGVVSVSYTHLDVYKRQGTLRADYADSFTENGTHGSDSVESAAREIAFFFAEGEVCPVSYTHLRRRYL